jgi:predicted amidohydrolase YtcJ
MLDLLFLTLTCPQDLNVEGVTVHSGAAKAWPASAVVVHDGRVAAPGAQLRAGAPVASLRGGHLYPGLVDAHAHLVGLGASLHQVDLVGLRSYDELIAAIVAAAKNTRKGQWIRGRGWDQNDWPGGRFPTHHDLSKAVPDHPVFLTRIDGHAALVNGKALQIAGVDGGTKSPSGGEVVKDDTGQPTGVLVDRAMVLVQHKLPAGSVEEIERNLLKAQEACLAAGLTCVHDAGMGPAALAVLRRLHTTGQWRLRVYVMLPGSATAEIRKGPWQTPDELITVRAVKSYADGALGSRGAALLEPYSDRKGHRGLMLASSRGIKKLAQLCADHGFQLCVHAIGDRANRAVLDAYQAVRFPISRRAARFRVEHAQVLAEKDFARFRELHVIPSMQPTHLTSDMPWAPARLGEERVAGAYAWRRFLALDLPVAFGSDFPVESHDPRKGLFAAVTTRQPGSEKILRPDQKLSRAEALRGFTAHAAYASFQEHQLGAVAAGMLADFTVFDRDILSCPDDELLEARVLLTVVGGRVVYRAER